MRWQQQARLVSQTQIRPGRLSLPELLAGGRVFGWPYTHTRHSTHYQQHLPQQQGKAKPPTAAACDLWNLLQLLMSNGGGDVDMDADDDASNSNSNIARHTQ
ncbi:hypothetical protein CCHR01_09108 [Colletotrichum chrysophilum]|uniref:Uncharacterized protein n=1 Tax=Colletotrichum chrysophilum TaxID=1836956 RepID=A0AAD9AJ10_9PEZI|nr:hypothetical protein CCHR01_09108 [Colletotrichum chrysophilum]